MIGEALFQPSHLLFILLVLLLFFGPQKLPGLGKGMGKGIREFKDALRGVGSSPEEEEEKKGEEQKTAEKAVTEKKDLG
jgi:sec-independent protein translocase protein TatA